MEIISKDDVIKALRAVGVSRAQTLYLQTDLRCPGMLEGTKTKEDLCRTYLESIFDLIGEKGTLVVPTYTTQVARFDIDFVWEKTPTLMGIFPEYVRCRAESLRSMHPIKSVCAIGKEKEFICANNGTNDYGWDSPFHRMLLKKAKILTIGLTSGYVVGIAHHLEAACCLPYVYNKLLKWSPIIAGKRDERQYFATVRYLDLNVEYNLTSWVKHMRRIGGVKSAKLGGSYVHMSDYEQVFYEGAMLLKDKPYYFLKEAPRFKYGTIPFDGPTSDKDNIAAKDNVAKSGSINWMGYYLLCQDNTGGDDEFLQDDLNVEGGSD